jgi:hypothetical protein
LAKRGGGRFSEENIFSIIDLLGNSLKCVVASFDGAGMLFPKQSILKVALI